MPPGPRALLDGKKLLERGDYAQAVEKLERATRLLKSNAQAWNYLGLACHRSGQATNAVAAYRQALALDQNLAEARFNLGCLWLEQNRPDLAREQFTTFTALRGSSVEGFLKLGAAQLRLRDAAGAQESFQKALRLDAQIPEALNGLGLALLQRNRPREAAQQFRAALKQQPDYRPALLNLATVSHRYLNDPAEALKGYQEYLALKPRVADWAAVNTIAQSLEQQLSPAARPTTTAPTASAVASAPAPKPQVAHTPAPAKVSKAPEAVKTSPLPTAPPSAPATPPTVVSLPPEPAIQTAVAASHTSNTPVPNVAGSTSAPPALVLPPTPKRSFLSRLNPFRRNRPATAKPVSVPAPVAESTSANLAAKATAAPPPPPPSSPYTYLSPAAAKPGDRGAAERAFAQGVQFQRANRLNEAAAAYKQALQLDPSYFEASYNLGLVMYEARSYRQSLAAWENALAIRPDSTDARYNFALALKAAGHPRDAANELEKVLASNPNETRAHLVLGNLYSDSLGDPARARAHYVRVLELDPRNPQSSAIRYWLVANSP